ncbi:MAG: biotin--[acetyl-CoA-carboxylase] ligase, partial [Vicinamibacterales bacterium]|nr:biotin--[acetyl-CoA-carboxylase] ligase [Vicinamibacterales bacterium]
MIAVRGLPDPSPVEPLPDDLAVALEAARGDLIHVGSPVVFLPSTASTNDEAARLAEAGSADGTTVIADTQTSGRGRMGRTWFSPAGAGLYVSVIMRLGTVGSLPQGGDTPDAARVPLPARLTLLAGVALAEAVRAATGLPADIKWPNDLVFSGKKLAGILAEGTLQQGVIENVILGVGINVRAASYPPDIAHRASSLETELGRPVDRGLLLATLL